MKEKDIEDLKLAFNREFTTGFGFVDSVIDARKPMNRGIFLGVLKEGKIKLRTRLKIGDGVGIWTGDAVTGSYVKKIIKDGKDAREAAGGDVVEIDTRGAKDGDPVYKTSSVDLKYDLGDEIKPVPHDSRKYNLNISQFTAEDNADDVKIFAKAYNKKAVLSLDYSGADVIYYDVLKDDCAEVKKLLRHSKFFVYTPRVLTDRQVVDVLEKIKRISPDGVLVGNIGLLKTLDCPEIHLDYSLNCINDIDIKCNRGIPMISPELNLKEVSALKDKRIIVMVHGDMVLMNSRQKLKAPELVDGDGRHFRVRDNNGVTEILNCRQLGLFNKAREYLNAGVKYFYIDTEKDADKYVWIYKRILSGEPFDDKKIRKGYTTGHFERGVC